MLDGDWTVTIKLGVYKEAGRLADCMANMGHERELGVYAVDGEESKVRYWEIYDGVGGSGPRLIVPL
ncbi:hypothetical protein LINPERPRIM_LOCUS16351 [Linum perenne]